MMKSYVIGLDFGTSLPDGQVLIDGLSAIVTTWTDTEIHAYVPEGAAIGSVASTAAATARSMASSSASATRVATSPEYLSWTAKSSLAWTASFAR